MPKPWKKLEIWLTYFLSEAKMLPTNIFLDTEILLDNIIPSRRDQFKCSCLLIDDVTNGKLKALTADYVLSEIMGNLKSEKEAKKGTSYIPRETLTPFEKLQIQNIVMTVKNIPNLKIFSPTKPISQQDIYNIVSKICVQTKDALVLLTALDARSQIAGIGLITRDERLLVRSKSQIASAHPSEYITKCPHDCQSIASCRHRK
jgi:hypothetical protein